MSERPKLMSELGKARLSRVSGMGLNGLAASTIGFVMLACIGVGYFGGSWLDRKLGTTWAMPVGSFIGMAAGFVEMFRTLKRVSESTKWPGAASTADEDGAAEAGGTSEEGPVNIAERRAAAAALRNSEPEMVEEPARQRLFQVPPPPLPEFGTGTQVDTPSAEEVAKRLHEGLGEQTNETSPEDGEESK